MAVGNPAKVVGYIEDEEPSLTMKHGTYAEILENQLPFGYYWLIWRDF